MKYFIQAIDPDAFLLTIMTLRCLPAQYYIHTNVAELTRNKLENTRHWTKSDRIKPMHGSCAQLAPPSPPPSPYRFGLQPADQGIGDFVISAPGKSLFERPGAWKLGSCWPLRAPVAFLRVSSG